MDKSNGNEILQRIVEWAKDNDNVIALIQTGSRARSDGKVDEFSDYDIEVIAKDISHLAKNSSWYKSFARVWVYQGFNEGQDCPTRLVVYDGGVKVDYTLATEKRIVDMNDSGLDSIYEKGYKVLVDKHNATEKLPKPTDKSQQKKEPTEKEFQTVVNEFWFEAFHIPAYIIREELWVVKFRDWTMKEKLLNMLEWDASLRKNEDVWYIGSHMKDWIDAHDWENLHNAFGHFDQQDSWRALIRTMDIFRTVSRRVAEVTGYHYPTETDENITNYVLGRSSS